MTETERETVRHGQIEGERDGVTATERENVRGTDSDRDRETDRHGVKDRIGTLTHQLLRKQMSRET